MKEFLHTDPELMRLSIPFSQDEMNKLESSLIEQGCREPIRIWNGLILDGHKRYKICIEENIDFEIIKMKFENSNEAAIWVCSHRIAQYDKKSTTYQYLIGKWYTYQKIVNFEHRKKYGYHSLSKNHLNSITRSDNHHGYTLRSMGEELGIKCSTLENYRKLSESLDRLDMIEPTLFKAILTGEADFSQNEIIRMLKMDNKTISLIRHNYVNHKDIKMRDQKRRERRPYKAVDSEIPLSVGIKEMPEFDPDMSLRGLTLTIPMWISAIERAQQQTDMNIASEDAKMQLGEMLIKLDDKIQNTLEVL